MTSFLLLTSLCPIPGLCDAAMGGCPLGWRATWAQDHVAPKSMSACSAPKPNAVPPGTICPADNLAATTVLCTLPLTPHRTSVPCSASFYLQEDADNSCSKYFATQEALAEDTFR